MSLADWQLDLRAVGYDGDFNYESLKKAIEDSTWRFEALVHFPPKKDPDWPNFSCRATKGAVSLSGTGETDVQALGKLLLQVLVFKE